MSRLRPDIFERNEKKRKIIILKCSNDWNLSILYAWQFIILFSYVVFTGIWTHFLLFFYSSSWQLNKWGAIFMWERIFAQDFLAIFFFRSRARFLCRKKTGFGRFRHFRKQSKYHLFCINSKIVKHIFFLVHCNMLMYFILMYWWIDRFFIYFLIISIQYF